MPTPRAFAVLYDPDSNTTWEAVANLSAGRVDRLQQVPGAQPILTARFRPCRPDRALRPALARRHRGARHPRFQQRDHRRLDRRILRAARHRTGPRGPRHPVLLRGEYAQLLRAPHRRRRGARQSHHRCDPRSARYRPEVFRRPANRPNLGRSSTPHSVLLPAPLSITQSSGPGFRVEDGEVRWQKWRFRFALHPREGLVLYMVGYEDGGRVRPVLYRGSLSEMVVPYGDPSGGWFFRNSFDAGELGLGLNATPLRAGVDCPQNCTLYERRPLRWRGPSRRVPARHRPLRTRWRHRLEARRRSAPCPRPGAWLRLHRGQL